MLKFGYISELNVSEGTVRVHFTDDDIVSALLPVSMPATKADKYSFPFSINEHVWCLMDENCEFGVVGGAIYNQKTKPPSGSAKNSIDIDINSGKLKLRINRQTGDISLQGSGTIDIEANSDIKLKSLSKIELTAPSTDLISPIVSITAATTSISGVLTVAGLVSAAGFSGAGGAPMAAPSGISAVGPISSALDVVAAGVSLSTHVHTSGAAGSPTSQPV